MHATLDLATFVTRWRTSTLSERSAAQSHFIELCHVLGQPTPTEADPHGEWYTFEKGLTKSSGGHGWADVWKRGFFAWEYKGKHKDLSKAYQQLQLYRDALANPKLLVVCDFNTFEAHTNFTDTVPRIYRFTLDDLLADRHTDGTYQFSALRVLRAVFTNPDLLHPKVTPAQATEQVAADFARLADSLRQQHAEPHAIARFLMRLLFCLFAQDTDLLPGGLLTEMLNRRRGRPDRLCEDLHVLFGAMRDGGDFWGYSIRRFNGKLFDDDNMLPLNAGDAAILERAAKHNWGHIEPSIFGTLFERTLDPAKHMQIGAHYTSKSDILDVVEPVLMQPLRRQWEALQAELALHCQELAALDAESGPLFASARSTAQQAIEERLHGFVDLLGRQRILDPACGSGNFLYVSLTCLLNLWREVRMFAIEHHLNPFNPGAIGPHQLFGIEINVYAHQLASLAVWIGYLQWLRDNGYPKDQDPVLDWLENIVCGDALLQRTADGTLSETLWPEVDFIVGNPPFLGDKKMRAELGDAYVDDLRTLYAGRVPGAADLVTYWFDRALAVVKAGKGCRVGLIATQGIRGRANRRVLERITEQGAIFMAWRDRPWVLDGVNVRVSLIGFDDGRELNRSLDGVPASVIYADLSAHVHAVAATALEENRGIGFLGVMKAGPFDIDGVLAAQMLSAPMNPNGRPNSDVVKRRLGGQDLTGRARDGWLIDFGVDMLEEDAALYELPYEYVRTHVRPVRVTNRRARLKERWWIHGEARPGMRRALVGLRRYIATPEVSKHRLFIWVDARVIPDHQLIAFAREDDFFFGVLQSRIHELWSRRMGTQLREAESGFRYTPSTVLATFPFPWPPSQEPPNDPLVEAVAEAARLLVAKRDAWLNPPGTSEVELKQRTLTNLYNQRPTWLALAHERLDHAVLDAYGWPHDLADEQILERLLRLNLRRATVVHTQDVIQQGLESVPELPEEPAEPAVMYRQG